MLGWLIGHKIVPHIPVWDSSKREDGTFSCDDFSFDHDANVYVCPGGKILKTTGKVHDGNTLHYRASKLDCEACPLKPKCCPKAPAHKIPRDVNEAARDDARSLMRTEAYQQSARERKKIEGLFGEGLAQHGHGQAQVTRPVRSQGRIPAGRDRAKPQAPDQDRRNTTATTDDRLINAPKRQSHRPNVHTPPRQRPEAETKNARTLVVAQMLAAETDATNRVFQHPRLQADMLGAGGNPTKPTLTTHPDYATLNPGCRWSRPRDSLFVAVQKQFAAAGRNPRDRPLIADHGMLVAITSIF